MHIHSQIIHLFSNAFSLLSSLFTINSLGIFNTSFFYSSSLPFLFSSPPPPYSIYSHHSPLSTVLHSLLFSTLYCSLHSLYCSLFSTISYSLLSTVFHSLLFFTLYCSLLSTLFYFLSPVLGPADVVADGDVNSATHFCSLYCKRF